MLFFYCHSFFSYTENCVSETFQEKRRVISDQSATASLCSGKGGHCTAVMKFCRGRSIVDYFAKLKPCREKGVIFYHRMMIEKGL